MRISQQIEKEINSYLTEKVFISEGNSYSEHDLKKRIMIYANGIYPDGKLDSKGNYKYWYDISQPRIDDDVKNVDFDTKHVEIYVDPPSSKFDTSLYIANASLKDWLKKNGQAKELNESIERFSGWGNVIWKKVKGKYERLDPMNTFIINTTVQSLDETSVIERHQLTQSAIRKKIGIWQNVESAIKECGNKEFQAVEDNVTQPTEDKETPYYEIFERNGEVSEAVLREAQIEGGIKPTVSDSEDDYILAKIIIAGLQKGKSSNIKILYADKISKMPYKEAHRGRYNGRWWRLGIYEILFDVQTRANEIGNQIARGLEWASKVILNTPDRLIVENILADLANGDIIKASALTQVNLRMTAFDQLAAEWNRIVDLSKDLTKSYEVVQGETMPVGTPARLAAMLNTNANKFFDYLREKIGGVFEEIFDEWILPDFLNDIKTKEVIEIAGDSEFMTKYYESIANAWYIQNLLSIGPHNLEARDLLIQKKIEELKKRPKSLLRYEKEMFDGLKARAKVVITGENVRMNEEVETYLNFVKLEQDPVRRTALIEQGMRRKGIDVSGLPKSPPMQPAPLPTKSSAVPMETIPGMVGATV